MARFSKVVTIVATVAIMMVASATAAFATTAPDIISPHPNQSITSAPVLVTGLTEENAFVQVWEDPIMVGSGWADGAGIFQFPINVGGFGTHTIKARTLGADLTWSPFSALRTFTTDVAPAQPLFTGPAENAVLNTATVTTSGTGDNDSTITLKEGAQVIASGITVSAHVWSRQVTLSQGLHTLTAIATDSKGRTTTGGTVTFRIDTVAPAAPTISTPSAAVVLPSGSVVVSGSAEASATVKVYEGTTLRGTTTTASNGAWSTTIGFANGTHTITARAIDAAGNTSAASAARQFVVDTTGPQVTITTADNSVFLPGDGGVVRGTATDNWAVARIELVYTTPTGTVGRSANATCSGCGGTSATWSDSPASLAPGIYEVSATAVDLAGHRSATPSVTIVVV